MEKCTFCVQRIQRTKRVAEKEGTEINDSTRELNPACVNACPTNSLVFGDVNDPGSKVSNMKSDAHHGRGYELLEHLGVDSNVTYLKKIDETAKVSSNEHH